MAGANVNATDKDGGTALMTACERLSLRVVKELLSAGALPNIALPRDGRTALMFCCFRPDLISALVAAGVDVNARAKDGTTTLMLVVRQGFPEAVGILIEAGADVNARNNKGQSVLLLAIQDGDEDTKRLVREAGAIPQVESGLRRLDVCHQALLNWGQHCRCFCSWSDPTSSTAFNRFQQTDRNSLNTKSAVCVGNSVSVALLTARKYRPGFPVRSLKISRLLPGICPKVEGRKKAGAKTVDE
jgi:ankyrin repeat protein